MGEIEPSTVPRDAGRDALILGAPVPVALFDRELHLIGSSEGWHRRFGDDDTIMPDRIARQLSMTDGKRWKAAIGRLWAGPATNWQTTEAAGEKVAGLRLCLRPVPDAEGRVTAMAIFAEDRIPALQIRSQLEVAKARVEDLTDLLGIGIVEHDFMTGKSVVSESYLELLGLAPDEVPQTTEDWMALLRPSDVPAYLAARQRALDPTGDGRFCCEIHPRVHGAECTMEVRTRVTFEGEGAARHPRRIVGVTIDRTETHRMREALARAQKLETVGRLAGTVAHDFNNILSVILANLELAERQAGSGAPTPLLHNAIDAIEMGAALTRRLLALAGGHGRPPRIAAIDEHIVSVWDIFRQVLSESIELRFHPGAPDGLVEIDLAEFDGAILNLVLNARDAQAKGGRIDLRTEVVTLDAQAAAAIRGGRPGRFVRIAVCDKGPGLPKEVADRLGEPFLTTKPPGQGNGLGLTSVMLAVERGAGFLQAAGAEGGGAEMVIYLPARERPAVVADEEPRPAPTGTGQLVLVVEDDPLVREAALLRLEALGYAVRETGSAEAALELIEAGEPVDLVFSDVVMQGPMSGFDLVQVLAERHPGIATLLTSGHVSATMRKSAAHHPQVPLLVKPYRLNVLAEAVAEALRPRTGRA